MAETLLRTDEVAALLRVHPKHVYRLLKKGLPARRVGGGEWRFSRDDVLAWSGGRDAPAKAPLRQKAPAEAAPSSIVAANGDVELLVLLELAARLGPPLIGFCNRTAGAPPSFWRRGRCSGPGLTPTGSPPTSGPSGWPGSTSSCAR